MERAHITRAGSARALLCLLTLAACGEKEGVEPVDSAPPLVETDAPPVVAELPTLQAWVGVELRAELGAYVSDDGAPAVDLSYGVSAGEGSFEAATYVATFTEAGSFSVDFEVADAAGQATEGSFEVEVAVPLALTEGPSPEDGAEGVGVDTGLSWGGGGGFDAYHLYVSTELLDLVNADTDSEAFVASLTDSFWQPPARLEEQTRYYWRVDAALGDEVLRGPTWTFETAAVNGAPSFGGLQGLACAGADAVQLTWRAGTDPEEPAAALRYAVYLGSGPDDVDWSAPVATSEAGASSIVLDSGELSELQPGASLWFAVRAVDSWETSDDNTLALPITLPAASASVLFVDAAASSGGDGSLGDPLDSVQDAIDALESAGGGVILLAEGDYGEGLTFSVAAPIALYGGLPSLTELDASADQRAILEARAPQDHQSLIWGSADPLVVVDSAGALTQLGGLWFDDSAAVVIEAVDASLVLSEVDFDAGGQGGQLAVDVSGEGWSVGVYGARFEGQASALHATGVGEALSLAGSRLYDISGSVVDTISGRDGALTVPAGGDVTWRIQGNRAQRVGALLGPTAVAPESSSQGGELRVLLLDNDVSYSLEESSVELTALGQVGAGGEVWFEARGNRWLGVDTDCITLEVGEPARGEVDGPVSISITDNSCVHSNSEGFEVSELAAADGALTQLRIEDNHVANQEGVGVALSWFFEANRNDRGQVEVVIAGNRFFNSDTNIDAAIYGGEGLSSRVLIYNNYLATAAFDALELRHYAQDDVVPTELDLWVAFNHVVGSTDASAVKLISTDNTLATVTNNELGLCDVDFSEAVSLAFSGMGGGQTSLRNNVIAYAGGSGIEAVNEVYPELINNTLAFNGRASQTLSAVDQDASHGYAQTLVQSSVVWDNAAADLHRAEDGVGNQVDSVWSLVGDQDPPVGYGNLSADPQLAGGGELVDFDAGFRLQATSPAVDAGDPSWPDADGSGNDMGAFGGPGGGVVGWLGEGAARPFEVIGARPSLWLQHNAPLPSGDTAIRLIFTDEVDASTVDTSSVSVRDSGGAVAGSLSVDGAVVTFTPSSGWGDAEDVLIEVTEDVWTADGRPLRAPWRLSFGTAPASADVESEPNGNLSNATALSGQHLWVEGTLRNGSDNSDTYVLTVSAGQRLSLSTFSERLMFDAGEVSVQLLDASGDTLRWSSVGFADRSSFEYRDAYLDHVFTDSGEVYLVLQDESGLTDRVDYALQGWLR